MKTKTTRESEKASQDELNPQTGVPIIIVIVDERKHKTTMMVRCPDDDGALSEAWKTAAKVAADYHASWLVPS